MLKEKTKRMVRVEVSIVYIDSLFVTSESINHYKKLGYSSFLVSGVGINPIGVPSFCCLSFCRDLFDSKVVHVSSDIGTFTCYEDDVVFFNSREIIIYRPKVMNLEAYLELS